MLDKLQQEIKKAMLASDRERLDVLRMLKSAMDYQKIELGEELKDSDFEVVVAREIKKRQDASSTYLTANNQDKADQELAEISILNEFLPEQIDDQILENEVKQAISQTEAESMKDIGKVMAILKPKLGSTVSGSRLSTEIRKQLS